MQTRIQGTTMPVLDVQLEPNKSVKFRLQPVCLCGKSRCL